MLSLCVALALTASVRELNDAGMKAYRIKQLPEAAALFTKALDADPDDKDVGPSVKEHVERARLRAVIHHNLACVQALRRAKGNVCDGDNYRDTIVEHLHKAVALDPSRLDRALTDPDLAGVRDTLGFQSLLGLSAAREADLPALLARVHWWSPGVGAYGSRSQLVFKADGTVVLTTRQMSEEGKVLAPTVLKGKWKLAGRALTFEWADGKKWAGTFSDSGLELDGQHWRDSPSECDA